MIHGIPIRLHGCNERTAGVTRKAATMNDGTDTTEIRDGDVIEFTHRGERLTAEVMLRSDDQLLLDLLDGDRPAFAQVSALTDVAVFRPDVVTFTVAA